MSGEEKPPAEAPEEPGKQAIDAASEKVKTKMGAIKKASAPTGVKPGVLDAAIPNHIGAAARVKQQPLPRPQAPTAKPQPLVAITLGPVEGSELHIAQLEVQLTLKDLDIVALRERLTKSQEEFTMLFKSVSVDKLGEQKKQLQGIMVMHKVPDGGNIHRNDDGTYVILPKRPPVPGTPGR